MWGEGEGLPLPNMCPYYQCDLRTAEARKSGFSLFYCPPQLHVLLKRLIMASLGFPCECLHFHLFFSSTLQFSLFLHAHFQGDTVQLKLPLGQTVLWSSLGRRSVTWCSVARQARGQVHGSANQTARGSWTKGEAAQKHLPELPFCSETD